MLDTVTTRVKVIFPGTHRYFLGREKEHPVANVELLCRLWLAEAGYRRRGETWYLRVEKSMTSSPLARLVRVVGYNHAGVQVRVKATSNAKVDHRLTLIRPDKTDYDYAQLFLDLRRAEAALAGRM
jgi:hypothetical protein